MARTAPGQTREEIMADDYAENMFKDGNNRAERNPKVHNAPAYDRAAHTPDSDVDMDQPTAGIASPVNTSFSRDGTDAAGKYDETGGSLGGTEDEIDDLEATGTPVDKTPHMQD